MSLHVDASIDLGTLQLRVQANIEPGQVVAVLGPNGAGKSTLLRALAGLIALDAGSIRLSDVVIDDADAVFVPPERRSVGVMFQDYLLFPHLSALDNVAFGPRARGATKADARALAAGWLERVGLGDRSHHKPSALSGGQSQRVALARALATAPQLLLLDEPLAALDPSTRAEVRRELRSHLAEFGGIAIVVTHDPLDALALADMVLVLEDGEVTQFDTLDAMTRRPRTRYVANLLGLNLLGGRASGTTVTLADHSTVSIADSADGDVMVLIRPSAVSLHRGEPDTSARNVWRRRVGSLDLLGDRVRVRLVGDDAAAADVIAEVTPGALRDLGLVEGNEIWASVKATDIEVYPA